jgi:carboxyl-terminal processing protease
LIAIFLLSFQPAKGQLFNDEGLKFMRLFDWIKSRYVDSVNIEKFGDEIIRESLHKLDPHSVYLTRDEQEEMNESLKGNFEGIGINFNILNDTIYIVSPIHGGPSEKAGIKAGDRIIRIEGETVAGIHITSKQVTSKLKGKSGSIVHLEVKRKPYKKLISFAITRNTIPINSVDAAYKVDASTGYIKLTRFSHTTVNEVTRLLTQYKNENIKNLILDLSGNGGGYFEVAIALADEFLDTGKLIVSIKGLHTENKEFSTSKGLFEKGKLVILIDEGSASASEILAGSIQDWDRGIIVGRRSYGKGLVQTQLKFPDGSVVRLTIARYYTPTGRLIQKPYNDGYTEYSNELNERIGHGELLNKDSIRFNDSLKYYTLKLKRKVYGGGGIMPDVFVPVDTSRYSNYYRRLIAEGLLNSFVIQYVDDNRSSLQRKYPEFKAYMAKFEVDKVLLDKLIQYAGNRSVKFDSASFEHSKRYIVNYIKALIARSMWSSSEFFEIYNQEDPSFTKALEVIKNWNHYLTSN